MLVDDQAVGDFYKGGVVFWIDPNDNTQGLVSSIYNLGDQSPGNSGGLFGGVLGQISMVLMVRILEVGCKIQLI